MSIPVLVLLALLAAGVVFLKSDLAAERVCGLLRAGVQERLHLETDIQACRIDLLPPALEASGLRLAAAGGGRLLTAASILFELDPLSLLAGEFEVDRVLLVDPHLHLRLVDGALVGSPAGRSEAAAAEPMAGAFPSQLEVEGGRLDLVLERWGLLQLQGLKLSLSSAAGGRMELAGEVAGGSLDRAGPRGTSLEVRPSRCRAVLADGTIEIEQCALGLDAAVLKGQGLLRFERGQPRGRLSATLAAPVVLAPLAIDALPDMRGQIVLSADASADASGWRVTGALDLDRFGLGPLHDVDLQSSFTIDAAGVDLRQFRLTCPAGRVSGRTRVHFDERLSLEGALILERADLIRALELGGLNWDYIDLRGTGQAELHGQLLRPEGPRAVVDARMQADRLRIQSGAGGLAVLDLDGAALAGQGTFDRRGIRIAGAQVDRGQTRVTGEGLIRWRGWGVDARVRSSGARLTDLAPIAGIAADGVLVLDAVIGHTVLNPTLTVDFDAERLALGGHALGRLQGRVGMEDFRLRFDPLELARHGGALRITGWLDVLEPYRLQLETDLSRIALADLAAAIWRIPPPDFLGGWAGGRVAAVGTLAAPTLDFKLAFADLRLGEQRFAEAGAIGRYTEGSWQLELLEARMGQGWLFARGSISADLQLDLMGYSTGLRAASFASWLPFDDQLDFRLDLHAEARGPLRSPAIEGWLKVYDTEVAGQAIGDSMLTASAAADHLSVQGRFGGQMARLELQARIEVGLPFSGTLRFASESLGRFLIPVGLAGADEAMPRAAVRGRIEAAGALLQPGGLSGRLQIDQLALALPNWRIGNSGPLQLLWRDGALQVEAFALAGTETRVRLRGGGTRATGLRLDATGGVGLALLPLLIPAFERAEGRAELALQIRGDWWSPRVAGTLALTADRIRMAGLPFDIEAVTGQASLSPERVDIERLAGNFGGGRVAAWGQVELDGLSLEDLGLTIELDGVRYNAGEGLWGVGTGTLSLTGQPTRRLRLGGQVRVQRAAYAERISLVSLSNGIFRRRRPRTRTYDRAAEWVDFDVRLLIPEKLQVLYDLELARFEAEMKGELRLTGTNERTGLLGELEALSGEVAYLSKVFELDAARVAFVDETAIEPKIEIRASRSETVDRGEEGKTDYEIGLALIGRGDDLRIDLHSNPPLDERDIVTLLSLGITSRDMDRLQGDDLIGLGGEIFLRSLKADERLRKFFPFPADVIQPKYVRIRSRYSDQTQTTTPRLEAGVELRFISEDLDLDYSRSIYLEDGQRLDQSLDLSYRLSEGVSTRLRWESDVESDFGDLGLDLKLEWEW